MTRAPPDALRSGPKQAKKYSTKRGAGAVIVIVSVARDPYEQLSHGIRSTGKRSVCDSHSKRWQKIYSKADAQVWSWVSSGSPTSLHETSKLARSRARRSDRGALGRSTSGEEEFTAGGRTEVEGRGR